MPQIINTLQNGSPFGSAISDIGAKMFGPQAAHAAMLKQEIEDKQRAAYGAEELSRLVGEGTNGLVDPAKAGAMAVLGGYDPAKLADLQMFVTANKLGAHNEATTNAAAGAGRYNTSAENEDMNRAKDIHIADGNNRTSIAVGQGNNNATMYDTRLRVGEDSRYHDMQNNTTMRGQDVNSADKGRELGETARYHDMQNTTANRGQDVNSWTSLVSMMNKPQEATVDGKPGFVRTGDPALGGLVLPPVSAPTLDPTRANAIAQPIAPSAGQAPSAAQVPAKHVIAPIATAGAAGGKMTEGQQKALALFAGLRGSIDTLTQGANEKDPLPGYNSLSGTWNNGVNSIVGSVPFVGGSTARAMTSGAGQKTQDAIRDLALAHLYATSGQAFGQQEMDRQVSLVTPSISDGAEVIKAKKQRILDWVAALKTLGRNGSAQTPDEALVQNPALDAVLAKYK